MRRIGRFVELICVTHFNTELEHQDDARRISAVLSGVCTESVAPNEGTPPGRARLISLLEHFFDLPDLFFDLTGPVFGFAVSL